MNLMALEMYKWIEFHKKFIPSISRFHPNKCGYIDWRMYWCAHGAFVSVLPRQTGKTEMIIRLTNYFGEIGEDFLIVCPSNSTAKYIDQRLGGGFVTKNKIVVCSNGFNTKGMNYTNINLLIDEFCLLDYRNWLQYPWKTVTMLSTLL